jgi:fructose-bisphosphate aldolase, class I
MANQTLLNTIKQIAVPGKGILAADESHKTIGKRFEQINVENTELNRRDYRELLFTSPALNEYISGVILYEETLSQKSTTGITLGELLTQIGIVPGIKVDQGLVDLNADGEKVTQGLDGLAERLTDYKAMGAKFAKWRAVYDIGHQKPSIMAIHANAHALARYAKICQTCDIVPIVEPEILMDGEHTIQKCAEVTEAVLHEVFNQLYIHQVDLSGIILKPSMVIAGSSCTKQASVDEVAIQTVTLLQRTVPAAVPTINFLSGGQSAILSTEHLSRMNELFPNLSWQLSFSYGRALQAPSLAAWGGKKEQIEYAQKLMCQRARLNGLASKGQYHREMEAETV